MILVDSSVVIDAIRKRRSPLIALLKKHSAAVCGLVRAEVLNGAQSEHDWNLYTQILDELPQVPVPEPTWPTAGRILQVMRKAGHPAGFADAAIAAVAIEYGVPIWTRDADFLRIQAFVQSLQLVDESSL